MASTKSSGRISRRQAMAAAKRLLKGSSDFKILVGFLSFKARAGKSPFSDKGAEDTARRIGRQEQHQLLVDLCNGVEKGDDDE